MNEKIYLGTLWDKIYFKKISAIWVSYKKTPSQQNVKSLEQFILVKKFPRRY